MKRIIRAICRAIVRAANEPLSGTPRLVWSAPIVEEQARFDEFAPRGLPGHGEIVRGKGQMQPRRHMVYIGEEARQSFAQMEEDERRLEVNKKRYG